MGKHTCGECTRHGGARRHRQRVSPHPCQRDNRQQKRGMSTEANRDKHPSAHTEHRCCGCDPLHPQCNAQRHQMNEEEGVRAHSSPCATYNAGEEQWRTRRRKSEITWSSSTLELAKCRRTARTSSSRLQSTSTFRPYAARYRLRESYWSASKLATVPRVAPAAPPPPLPPPPPRPPRSTLRSVPVAPPPPLSLPSPLLWASPGNGCHVRATGGPRACVLDSCVAGRACFTSACHQARHTPLWVVFACSSSHPPFSPHLRRLPPRPP